MTKNKNTPSFTVLMALYYKDNPNLFDKALGSVFDNSTLPELVVLVVDGPIGPELREIIEKYMFAYKDFLYVVWLPENKGLANALNVGLEHVKTEFVARADADDLNLGFRFEEQLKYAKNGFDLFGSSIQEVDEFGNKISIRSLPIDNDGITKFLKTRNPFNHMTVFFRTQLARDCGGYPNLDLREDYGLWVKMIKKGAKCANSDAILVFATTGQAFYERRGGVRSVKAEIAMQKFLVHHQIKGWVAACLEIMAKSIVFLMPSSLRALVYKTLLR